MKSAIKRQITRTSGVPAGQFHRCFHRFGAGVAEKDFGRPGNGRELVQAFGQFDLAGIIEIGSRHVQELVGLIFDGLNNGGMAVSGIGDSDTGGKIDVAIAIDIPDFRATALGHHKRIAAGVGWGDVFGVSDNVIFCFAHR